MEFVPSKEGLYHYDFNLSVKGQQEYDKLQKQERIMII
jgi:hypothetical protein